MSSNPIEQAKVSPPFWMKEIRRYDALEIHPVREYAEDGHSFCEQCEPEEAHFWSAYGHLKEGGVNCFEDFGTEAEAIAFVDQLLGCYPHLRHP